MSLQIGQQLGSYEIASLIGKGGMGEVYRARDSKLKRDVAIKVLPEEFSRDTERIARFHREAEVLASLNHPHIAAIHDLAEFEDSRFLVLELVDGETLADRIARGPVPIDEALDIATQIAEALEAAHQREIIHRDLKPANIKVADEGSVKVLDFGLAKMREPFGTVPALSNSPTMMSASTPGTIMGTAAYMPPEQARGKDVGRTADVWAFGCVLYEMLTGRPAFDGETIAEILAGVLKADPDWNRLPPETPASIRTLLRRCLQKDPKRRLQYVADARIEIEESRTDAQRSVEIAQAIAPKRNRERLAWIIAGMAALLVVALAIPAALYFQTQEPVEVRFLVPTPALPPFPENSLAVSPDGRSIAFVAAVSPTTFALFVRSIESVVAQQLQGTEGAANPFWSPDSRYIAFSANDMLKKVAISGGPPLILCEMPGGNRAGTWNKDGVIVFSSNNILRRVSSAGGQPAAISVLDETRNETYHTSPYFLPDGRHFLYTAWSTEESDRAIYVRSLDSEEPTRLLSVASKAVYADPGYILYQRQGTLFAHPFDVQKLTFTGEPVRVADEVSTNPTGPHSTFSVSQNGALVFRTGAANSLNVQLAWFDRSGKLIQHVGSPGSYRGVDLSPDGKRLAVHRHDGNGGDVWVSDLTQDAMSRLTFDSSSDNSMPVWSPDGKRIAFGSQRKGKWGIYVKAADGTGAEELLVESNTVKMPMSWSPDGTFLVYTVVDPKTNTDQWIIPLTGDRKPFPLLQNLFAERWAQISPDGKWIAYVSSETRRSEIYVTSFPQGEGKWQLSTNGGAFPRWRSDGRELYFMSAVSNGKLMATDIRVSGSSLQPAVPHALFDSGYIDVIHSGNYHPYAVSPDGQRFLIPRLEGTSASASETPTPITVVLNWTAALRQE